MGKVAPASKLDVVAERVMLNTDLHELNQKLMFLDGTILRKLKERIDGWLEGYAEARHETDEKKKAG